MLKYEEGLQSNLLLYRVLDDDWELVGSEDDSASKAISAIMAI